ncbi:hypothetical protein O9649_26260 [Achromobacter dolens]|uniref:Uncharacterized protein n=1 Tax=Alcaligenes xylosoxydans xylosoxydans TaxID=85698 RepID=A0A1R1JN61_ALCXX|nr:MULTISPECIES: hypothetical protein [Achromobacter]MCZ8411296.1 hypothetical protein [Achromobacter dolens]OMG80727.1 hypothetical protein BIZ92_12620 [Achromobacter xylosoxidans]
MSHPSHRGRAREARVRTAYKTMKQIFDRCKAAGNTLKQTHLAIRAGYPWGERRGWPYKAWLIARREFYEKHGLPLKDRQSISDAIKEAES